MIKFIILLPLKIIGLLFMAIGATLDGVNRRRIEQEKQAEKQRREYERIVRIESARIEKEKREQFKREKQAEKDREKLEREKRKQADRCKAETFKADQARTDIEHYKIQRSELLKLYTELEKQYIDAATDSKKEILFRKQIALNNQIRGVDRQIEKAQYTINKAGP